MTNIEIEEKIKIRNKRIGAHVSTCDQESRVSRKEKVFLGAHVSACV